MFTNEQKSTLAAPLSSGNVKSRKQAGRPVSYIEGWHAIAEANRIFGFDSWARETTELRLVSERERKIGGDNGSPGFGVSYIAKVRITVFHGDDQTVREGVGAGHGIDRDCGQAHESAIKEAETDAMKRALITFGNPFGLALYDKEQANVADEPDAKSVFITDAERKINAFTTKTTLEAWWKSDEQHNARRFVGLNAEEVNALKNKVLAKLDTFKTDLKMAG